MKLHYCQQPILHHIAELNSNVVPQLSSRKHRWRDAVKGVTALTQGGRTGEHGKVQTQRGEIVDAKGKCPLWSEKNSRILPWKGTSQEPHYNSGWLKWYRRGCWKPRKKGDQDPLEVWSEGQRGQGGTVKGKVHMKDILQCIFNARHTNF